MRVFVTTELFPFTAGGIGRVVSNILRTSSPEELSRTLVIMIESTVTQAQFESIYPGVRFLGFREADYTLMSAAGDLYPPVWAFTNTIWHWRSVLTLQALMSADAMHGPLDYVEFPDWGGLAFAVTQHKRLGLGFQEATLAVRLHSTDGIITEHEARDATAYGLSLFDIERKALADADLVVGQLATVAEAVRAFYGFDEREWADKLVVHAPAVLLEGAGAPNVVTFGPDTPLVFSSKLQHIKRPDVFVRGCVGFLRSVPQYRGKVVFLAHASDDAYARRIRKLIPLEFEDRFEFVSGLAAQGREQWISGSVCVFANGWESFCLAAYEAGLAGALCILNERTVAFGQGTPWESGVNCLKFDGTPLGLTAVLEDAFRSGFAPAERVRVPMDPAPWALAPAASTAPRNDPASPLVSVIVPHFNLGSYLLATLDSILASDYSNIEVIVADDASTEEWSRHLLDRVAGHEGVHLKVVRSLTNSGLATTRNVALAHCSGEYVLPLDADDLIHPEFIGMAVRALETQPAFGFVVPQVAFFLDGEQAHADTGGAFSDYAVFQGEARYSGLFENRYSTATMLVRRSVVCDFKYREELDSYEDWDLYQRMVAAGVRSLVTNTIQFFYRRRADSMIHSDEARDRRNVHRHDILRGKTLDDFAGVPAFVVAHALAVREKSAVSSASASAAELRELADYRDSETVFAALTVARALDRHAPWLLNWMKLGLRVGWRGWKRVRGSA